MQLWLLLLNNISNPILTSTRSHPFHVKARDSEPIYSTKRRLNIDYCGSSTLKPRGSFLSRLPEQVLNLSYFSLSPIPKLLRAIPPSSSPPPPPRSYSRFCDARISSNLSTCTVHKQQQQRRHPGVNFFFSIYLLIITLNNYGYNTTEKKTKQNTLTTDINRVKQD